MKFLNFAKKATENEMLLYHYIYTKSEEFHIKYNLGDIESKSCNSDLHVVYFTADNRDLENIKMATLSEVDIEKGTFLSKELSTDEIKLIHDLGIMI